jgi:hypothetical protein
MWAPERDRTFRFSTNDLAPSRRASAVQQVFGEVVRLQIDVDHERPVEMTVDAVPGLRRTRMASALTARMRRERAMLSDGEDAVCLIMRMRGRLALSQCGRETLPDAGDGVLLLYSEPATLQFAEATYLAVRMPFAPLASVARDLGGAAARRIPGDTEALKLLRAVLSSGLICPTIPGCRSSMQTTSTTSSH